MNALNHHYNSLAAKINTEHAHHTSLKWKGLKVAQCTFRFVESIFKSCGIADAPCFLKKISFSSSIIIQSS